MRLSSLSILIPAYNVAPTIASVVLAANDAGQKATDKLEIIVIDDGSTDKTNRILRSLEPKVPHITIMNHDTNQGYGKTIKELYSLGRHDWLFSLPGDGQFDAGELHRLAAHAHRADMIVGTRVYRRDPLIRIIQSRIYNWLLGLFFGLRLTDVNSIRLMKRSMIRAITLSSNSAFVDAELAVRAHDAGFRTVEIPVAHKERKYKGATGGNVLKTVLPTTLEMIRLLLTR